MKFRMVLSALLLAAGLACCTADSVESMTVALPENVKLELVKVEAGTFTMGAPDGENFADEEEHLVTLTRDFYIGKTEVTQAQWEAVMGSNPSHFKGGDLPVECVSWDDAMAFCKKLNDSGKAPNGMKFTLPTEAQWEYAVRGGKKSNGYQYSGSGNLDEVAWYYENSGDRRLDEKELLKDSSDASSVQKLEDNNVVPEVAVDFDKLDKNLKDNNSKTHPVGQKKANELGLHDMSGSVWEWCLDQYEGDYADDPEFLSGNAGTRYVFRGGGWRGSAGGCRSANRHGHTHDYSCYDLGFRVALVPAQ